MLWWIGVLLLVGQAALFAGPEPYAQWVEQTCREAKTNLTAQPTQSQAGWMYSRACFLSAELATNDALRAHIAHEGIAASRYVIKTNPTNAQAHYYLGLNLGELASTRRLSALHLVSEMETELKIAARLDSKMDFAGADRALGLLYCDAPAWPVSIGSFNKARQHLKRALELAPDYPDNYLCNIECSFKWKDRTNAVALFHKLETLWPEARKRLTNQDFNWFDWEKRRDAIQTEFKKLKKDKTPEPSPRGVGAQ